VDISIVGECNRTGYVHIFKLWYNMKTYNNLYDKICSFENIYRAYLKARKSKRYHHDVLKFSSNLEENLIK